MHRSTRQAKVYVVIGCSDDNYNLEVNPLDYAVVNSIQLFHCYAGNSQTIVSR